MTYYLCYIVSFYFENQFASLILIQVIAIEVQEVGDDNKGWWMERVKYYWFTLPKVTINEMVLLPDDKKWKHDPKKIIWTLK